MAEKVKTRLILKHNDVNIPVILNYKASEITHQILYQKVRESLSSYGFDLRDIHLSLNGKTIIPCDANQITSSGIVNGDILIILNLSKLKKLGNDKSQSIIINTINNDDLLFTQTTPLNTSDANFFDESKIVSLSHKISNNLIFTAIHNLSSKKCGKCYELLLIAVHVMMLELGYLPIFKKTTQFQSSKDYLLNTGKNFPNNYVLPSGWDSSNGFYNLSYWHPAAELLYCKLVCVPLNDSLIIHAIIEGDDIRIDQDIDNIKDNGEDADSSKSSQKVEDTSFFQTLFDNLPLLREDKERLGFVLTNIFSKSLLSLTLDLREFIENYDKHSLKAIPLLPSATNASTSSNEDENLLYTDVAYQLGHCYKNLAKLSASFKDTVGWPLLYDTMLRNGLVAIIQANKSYFAEHHFKNGRGTCASDKQNFERSESYEPVDVEASQSSGIPSGLAEQTSASVLHWLRSMPSYVLYAARHDYGLPTFNASALPPEIKSKILLELTFGLNLEPRHLVRVSGINREFYALARQPSLWKRLCLIDFPDLATTFPDHASSREATTSLSNSSTTNTSDNNAASDSIDWYVMYAERYKLRAKYTALARARATAVEHGAVRMRRLLPPSIPFHRHPHHGRYPPFYPMFPPYGPPFNHANYPLNHENFWPAPYNSRGGAWPYQIAHHSDEDLGVDFDDGVVRRPLLNSGGRDLGAVVVTSHPRASSPPSADATIRSIPVCFAATTQGRGLGSDQFFVIRDRSRPLPPLYYLCGGVDHPDPNPPDSEDNLTVTSASDPTTLSNLLNVNSLLNTHQSRLSNLQYSRLYLS